MMAKWIGVILLLVTLPLPAQAVLLYDQETLESWPQGIPGDGQGTREEALRANLNDFILMKLTTQEMESVRGVQIKYPPYNENPLQFYSIPLERTIYLPVQSIKFYDELCTAMAWLDRHNYSLESIGYYMSMFKYNPGATLPPPLKALQIPDDALKDPWVDNVSGRLFNYGMLFIMAHELGHIRYQHSKQDIDFVRSQEQEKEADNFALEIFRRQRTFPPVFVYFQAATFYTENPGDFTSDAGWRAHVLKESHPFTADRLHSFAAELRNRPEQFSQNERDKARVRSSANQIDGIARILEDAEFQKAVTKACKNLDVKTLLKPRRVGEPIPIAPQE